MNIERLFQEFNRRPLRNNPDEVGETLGQTHVEKKMSSREKARAKFIRQHKLKQK